MPYAALVAVSAIAPLTSQAEEPPPSPAEATGQGVVTGIVRFMGTRAPAADTPVEVGPHRAFTDDQGVFRVADVPADTPVEVRTDGSEPLTITLSPGETVEVVLWVRPPTDAGREVVVRYERRPHGAVVRRIPLADRQLLPGSLNDPLRALSVEPGLARTPYDAGWLLVRGGDDRDTGIYLDGVRLPIAYHLGGYTSVLHPDLTEDVAFWPGAFPARYGDALSGAVDLVPTQAPTEATRLSGGVSVVFAQAAAQVPTRFGGVSLAVRRSYLDGVLAAVLGPESARIAPRFWDVQGQVHLGDATLTAIALSDSIDAPSPDVGGTVTLEQDAVQLQGNVPIGPLSVRPWFTTTERGVSGDNTPQTLREWTPGLRVQGEHDAGAWRVESGAEGERRSYRFDRAGDEVERNLWTGAPYAALSIGRDLAVWTEWRGRGVWVPDRPALSASMPRGGVRWTFGDVQLYGSAQRSTAMPSPTLLLAVSEGQYLGLERSDGLEVGLHATWRGWRWHSAAWERWIDDIAQVELDGSIGPSGGRARGLEAKLGWTLDGFDATVLGQWTRSERWEDVPQQATPFPLEQRTRLEVVALQRLPREWTLSGRLRATAGYPRNEIDGQRLPIEAYDLLTQQLVDLELTDADERLRPYSSLDLKVGRRFTFRSWRLTASLDVQNVTHRRVVEPVITGFGDARPSYGFGLPILPVLAIDGEVFVR